MNKFKIFLSALLITLVLTGCGKSPEEILSDAGDNMAALDNYHMDMNLEMEMSYEGTTLTVNVDVESEIDQKNSISSAIASTSMFGFDASSQNYTVIKDGKTISYTLEDDVWYKEESEYTEETFDFNLFKDATNIEELEDQENTYKISLSEEQIKQLLSNIEEEQTDTEDATIDSENVKITVTVDDKYVTKMVLEIPMKVESEGVSLDVIATMTIEFSKFNEVGDVTIPEEVVNEAIDMAIYEIESYAISYISEINWDIFFADEDMTYTNTELEYDGPAPTKVEVNIVNGEVEDGFIEINGYRVTVTDGEATDIVKID